MEGYVHVLAGGGGGTALDLCGSHIWVLPSQNLYVISVEYINREEAESFLNTKRLDGERRHFGGSQRSEVRGQGLEGAQKTALGWWEQ